MCLNIDGIVRYAPLIIHSFRINAPRKLLEAQQFIKLYHSYDEIDSIPDRLRWCRHHLGLMQKEVAECVGITRACYVDLETGAVQSYNREIVDKLAELFDVPPMDFLDDYNRFMYEGQGKNIKALRHSLGMKKRPFARWLNIDAHLLHTWETETKRVSRASWERYFKGKI